MRVWGIWQKNKTEQKASQTDTGQVKYRVQAKFPLGHKLSLKGQRILSNTFSSFHYLTALSNISIHVHAWSKRAIFYEREADLKVIHCTNIMKFDKGPGKIYICNKFSFVFSLVFN